MIKKKYDEVGTIKSEKEYEEADDPPATSTALFSDEGQRVWRCQQCGKKSKNKYEKTGRFCSSYCSHLRISSFKTKSKKTSSSEDKENESKYDNPIPKSMGRKRQKKSSSESSAEESEEDDSE